MKTRLFSLVLVLGLVLAFVPAVQAQGGGDEFLCWGLSAADCTILTTAMANNENMQSFGVNFTAEARVNGLAAAAAMMGESSDVPAEIALNASGSGSVVIAAESVPPIAAQMALQGSMSAGPDVEQGTINLVIKDGVFYFSEDGSSWFGTTFEDLMDSAELEGMMDMFRGDVTDGPLSPEDLLSGDPTQLLEAAGLGADVAKLLETPGFIAQQRLPDEKIDGQMMYVYQMTVDFAPLFASSDFQTLLNQAMTAAVQEDPESAQMLMMVPMLMNGIQVTMNRTIKVGADDGFAHGFAVTLDIAFDLGAIMASAGGTSSTQIPPITIHLNFDLSFNQINQAFNIQAPANAQMVSPDEMGVSK